jgi:hypothetical protein
MTSLLVEQLCSSHLFSFCSVHLWNVISLSYHHEPQVKHKKGTALLHPRAALNQLCRTLRGDTREQAS